MEDRLLSILVQGGAVSIALVALWVIYKMQNGQRQSFEDQMKLNRDTFSQIAKDQQTVVDRNTEAWIENTRATTSLAEKLKDR